MKHLVLGLSPRERRGEPPANVQEAGFDLTLRGQGLSESALSRAPRQQALIVALRSGPKTRAELRALGFNSDNFRALTARALIEPVDIFADKNWDWRAPLSANTHQNAAIEAISSSLGQFACHLLEGVTGSGKTEVYLQAIADALARQEQTLVLVPEIGLTPQLLQRFNERFDAPIVTLHSGLGNAERDRNWHAARTGEAAIIIGTRSAVFAPMRSPGLIIVDEEHDISLNQQDGLRYSARDVAVKRAQLSGCPIVLGSATPSLESMANATSARYQWHRLTKRAGGAHPPHQATYRYSWLSAACRPFTPTRNKNDRGAVPGRASITLFKSPGLCAHIAVPRLRLDRRMSKLRRPTNPAQKATAGAVPSLWPAKSAAKALP